MSRRQEEDWLRREVADTSFEPAKWLALLGKGDSDGLSEDILRVLGCYQKIAFVNMAPDQERVIDLLARLLLRILGDSAYRPAPEHLARLIEHNVMLANMVRLTAYGNADFLVRHFLEQGDESGKILVVYSHYCTVPVDVGALFRRHGYLASLWVSLLLHARWVCTEAMRQAMERIVFHPETLAHYTPEDARFPVVERVAYAVFYTTYLNPEKDHLLRESVYRFYRSRFSYTHALPEPDFNKVLVVSGSMKKSHAVYRSLAPQLRALRQRYRLFLFHMALPGQDDAEALDASLFEKVYRAESAPEGENAYTYEQLQAMLAEGFGIVFYPDISMNRPSLIMSGLRLAPVQATAYGHPVSTRSGEMDYFIGGQEAEPPGAQQHYSEKLILLPGLGVEPARLEYRRRGLKAKQGQPETLHVMCSWGSLKVNPHLLGLAQAIKDKAGRRICFECAGMDTDLLHYPAVRRDIEGIFGTGRARVTPKMSSEVYLQMFEACHLALDAYPFGGYNRIVDALVVGTPIVAYEGNRAAGRFASALLRQAGLEELVAVSDDEYVEKALRLIHDDAYRQEMTARIEGMDLERLLFNTGRAKYYPDAFDAMVADFHANKGRKQHDRTPIVIPER